MPNTQMRVEKLIENIKNSVEDQKMTIQLTKEKKLHSSAQREGLKLLNNFIDNLNDRNTAQVASVFIEMVEKLNQIEKLQDIDLSKSKY